MCKQRCASLKEFHSWLAGDMLNSGNLKDFDPTHFWAYSDYNHIGEKFPDVPEIMKVNMSE